jgi:2-oxoglutarate dehydrogenase E2 component (dihydrolipoamide succinyltransferase)
MKVAPAINSRWHEDRLELYDSIKHRRRNCARQQGPDRSVLREVQNLNLKGIAAASDALIERARAEKLTAQDVKGGTFTISNHGVSGSLFATRSS